MFRLPLALPLALVLAGCVTIEAPQVAPGPGKPVRPLPPAGICDAPQMQGLVGQPAMILSSMSLRNPVRIIKPGMAVTMDYAPERMNIQIGENGLIESVTCG